MSKHWTPHTLPRTHRRGADKRSRHGSPGRRRRRTSVSTARDIRLVLLGGILASLAYALVPSSASDLTVPVEPGLLAETMLADSTNPRLMAANSGTVRIIDGDTFHYGGEKIRIADIDTPELRGRCAYEKKLAARATRRMDQLLRQGPFELRPVGRDEDRYGRKLRVVTRGGRSLGDQLVAEGLARTWTGRREPWCA